MEMSKQKHEESKNMYWCRTIQLSPISQFICIIPSNFLSLWYLMFSYVWNRLACWLAIPCIPVYSWLDELGTAFLVIKQLRSMQISCEVRQPPGHGAACALVYMDGRGRAAFSWNSGGEDGHILSGHMLLDAFAEALLVGDIIVRDDNHIITGYHKG